MAFLGIRTGWGPQATKERRKHQLKMTQAEEALKLEQERTKQITKGDAAVAAAVLGTGYAPEPAGFLGLDWSDQNTQIGAGVVAVGAALAAKRMGWF